MLRNLAFALLSLPVLSGCYVVQAAQGQWQLLSQRQPLDAVIADDARPQSLRIQLEELRAAREFAVRELGLPDNASYRSYADIGRPFVVWSVVAAPEFSVEPRQWCFPVVGCVAYRGYFRESSARAFAAGLRRRGYDVSVGGVPAYSTLGRFDDPVLSSMLRYGTTESVATLFHELAHQVVYIADDTAFNEAFAVTVEQAGLARWLESRGRGAELERWHARRARQEEFLRLVRTARADLKALYAEPIAVTAKRERKQARLDLLRADLESLAARFGSTEGMRAWLAEGLGNAQLASVATYWDCVPGFERELAALDGDLRRFYARVAELGRLPREDRALRLCSAPSAATTS